MERTKSLPDFHQSVCPTGAADSTGHQVVPDCLVLQYHRVARLVHDPLRLAVQPYHFESQMEYLATNCNVISLRELQEHLEAGIPFHDRTVAVTFDGGYADVLYTAKEVLERFEIPATVFVPSSHLIGRTPFWWDVLEDVLIAGHPPERFVLTIQGNAYRWPLTTQRDRFRAFQDLHLVLSHASPSMQKELLCDIVGLLGGPSEMCDSHATLGVQDLRTLEVGGLITIGGYPHCGTSLTALPEWEQVTEIGRNQQILEEALGHRIAHFAYPGGASDTGAGVTAQILQGLGFTLAFGASSGTVSVKEDTCVYELPRVGIRDWNPFTFHRCVETYLG